MWLVLHNDGLWHQVIISKYLKKLSIVTWLSDKNFCFRGVSVIWKGFLLTLPWLGRSLAWQVGNENNVLLGIDPIISIPDSLTLPAGFREYLEDLDIATLSQARNILLGSHGY